MHQGGRLQCVIGSLAPQMLSSNNPQVLVNKRENGIDGFAVPTLPTKKQGADLLGVVVHGKPSQYYTPLEFCRYHIKFQYREPF